jgi:glycosyltransferase involved in cell wall biosynthesis
VSHRRGTAPLVLDLGVLGRNPKGVGRVLAELAPRLVARDPGRYRVVCTRAALPLLAGHVDQAAAVVVPAVPQAAWEQLVLPAAAARLRAGAVYSHQECGALWGPPLLLHMPEDPEVRWDREPVTTGREAARRAYSRAVLGRALRRALVVASTGATLDDLRRNHGLAASSGEVVPLGVDLERFRPPSGPARRPPYFFHLASSDPRDRTDLVVDAHARLCARSDGAPELVVAGRLGVQERSVGARIARHGTVGRVSLLGFVPDAELAALYGGAVASVHAAPDEGFGLQPLEAMACGALVVSTPAAAVAEVTSGGEVVWAEPTADALADALETAWRDERRRARAATANRRCAEALSWERTATRLHELLEDLADGPVAPVGRSGPSR